MTRLKRALRPVKDSVIRGPARSLIRRHELRTWQTRGRPVPPPHSHKEAIVADYARRFGIRTFVETGTYLGEMVEAQRRRFSRIWSVELDPTLAQAARERFTGNRRIAVLEGDSGKVLADLLPSISPDPPKL